MSNHTPIRNLLGDGSTILFPIGFDYLREQDVKVRIGTAEIPSFPIENGQVRLEPAVLDGVPIKIYRETEIEERLVNFTNGAKLTQAELNRSALQNFYLLQEYQAKFDEMLNGEITRIATDGGIQEVDPAAMIAGLINDVLNSELLADLQANINAIDTNAQAILSNINRINTVDSRIDLVAGDISTRIIPIEQDVATAQSDIALLNTAQVNQASQITTLTADLDNTSAALQTEIITRADGETALSSRIDTLQAFTNRIFAQTEEPTAEDVGDIWYDTNDGNHPYRWDGSNWVSLRDSLFDTAFAQITAEQTARVDADGVLTARFDSLFVAGNEGDLAITAAVTNEETARIAGDDALASSISSLFANGGDGETYVTAQIDAERTVRISAEDALANSIDALQTSVDGNTATIASVSTAYVNADDALSTRIDTVQAEADGNTAAIASEQTARVNADAALSTQIDTVIAVANSNVSDIAANFAAITTEQTARADADSALSVRIDNVSASTNQIFAQNEPPTTSNIDDVWYDLDDDNNPYRWNGTAWESLRDQQITIALAQIATEQTARIDADNANAGLITSLTSVVDSNTSDIAVNAAGIVTEANTRASADDALSTRIDTVTATAAANGAAIQTEQTARADGDSANASAITTLTSTVNGNTSSIQTNATTIASVEGDVVALQAEYNVRLDVNGYVSGFGLVNNGTSSQFIVLADSFAIVTPGEDPQVPFVLGNVDGVSTVGITGALIVDGTITANAIATNTITATHIAANTITALELAANSIEAQHINSGVIVSNHLTANAVEAEHINVTNLAAISANMGTVTGGTFRTASSGQRVEISNSGTYRMWYGTGTKNSSNASFYLDNSGNAFFGGTLQADIVNASNIIDGAVITDALASNAVTDTASTTGNSDISVTVNVPSTDSIVLIFASARNPNTDGYRFQIKKGSTLMSGTYIEGDDIIDYVGTSTAIDLTPTVGNNTYTLDEEDSDLDQLKIVAMVIKR